MAPIKTKLAEIPLKHITLGHEELFPELAHISLDSSLIAYIIKNS